MKISDKKELAITCGLASLVFLILIGFDFKYAKPLAYVVTFCWIFVCCFIYMKFFYLKNGSYRGKLNVMIFIFFSLVSAWLVVELGINRVVDKNIEYVTCVYQNITTIKPHYNLTKKDEVILDLYGRRVDDISPVKLNSIFELGGRGTNLQRENVENLIKNKIVTWNLKVYEVRRSKDGTFKISTQAGVVDRRSDMQRLLHEFADYGSIISGRGEIFGERYENQNIGTIINLISRDENDVKYLGQLQTGSWVTVRGKISGVTMRNIELSPAMFENSSNQDEWSQIKKKEMDYKSKLAEYEARSCEYVWRSQDVLDSNSGNSRRFDIDEVADMAVNFYRAEQLSVGYKSKGAGYRGDVAFDVDSKLQRLSNLLASYNEPPRAVKIKCHLHSREEGRSVSPFEFNQYTNSYVANCSSSEKLLDGVKVGMDISLRLPYEVFKSSPYVYKGEDVINVEGIADGRLMVESFDGSRIGVLFSVIATKILPAGI